MKRIDTCQVCGAPRSGTQRPALCAEHRKEHDRERKARERKDNPERAQLRNRIGDYLAEARRQGATDDQAWWCAMAAMPVWNAGQTRPHWLAPFIAAELAWLRDNAAVFAALDARQWAAVDEPETVTIDDGWMEEARWRNDQSEVLQDRRLHGTALREVQFGAVPRTLS